MVKFVYIAKIKWRTSGKWNYILSCHCGHPVSGQYAKIMSRKKRKKSVAIISFFKNWKCQLCGKGEIIIDRPQSRIVSFDKLKEVE